MVRNQAEANLTDRAATKVRPIKVYLYHVAVAVAIAIFCSILNVYPKLHVKLKLKPVCVRVHQRSLNIARPLLPPFLSPTAIHIV